MATQTVGVRQAKTMVKYTTSVVAWITLIKWGSNGERSQVAGAHGTGTLLEGVG